MTTIYDLPEPNPEGLERSKALSHYIAQEIDKQNGWISFSAFMAHALYHPSFGYYNAESFTLGEHGDFTTAPEISPLFAACLAKQLQQIFTLLGKTTILELGAGTGQLAYDLLHALNTKKCLPDQYYIYETSQGLRKKQQTFLQQACPEFFSRIIWLDTLPANFIGTIIANEVLDALPVHCFKITKETIKERGVCIENNSFAWTLKSPRSDYLTEKVSAYKEQYSLPIGYESEINLQLISFIKSLANTLSKGVILLADYGYGQAEYYHHERRQGTLTCFYQHRKNNNPLIMPGLQDITAHVDFTHVVDTAIDYGCSLSGYTSQASFLLALDLIKLTEEQEQNLSTKDAFRLHHAIKLLTLPTEMGERIKVMALNKNLDTPLTGFSLQDRRRDL